MTAPPPPPSTSCPRCAAQNLPGARFCGACGAPITTQSAGSPPPPPPASALAPPPPPPPMNPRLNPPGRVGGAGGGSGSSQAVVNADITTAFQMAIQAAASVGAQVLFQSPPQSARVSITHRDFMNTGGMRVRYIGDIAVTPMGPRQSNVRMDCRAENLTPVIGVSIIVVLLAAFLNTYTGLFLIILLLGVALTGWQVYTLSNAVPRSKSEKMILALQMAAQGGMPVGQPMAQPGAAAPYAAPPPPPPPMSAPAMHAAPPPPPPRFNAPAAPPPPPLPTAAAPPPPPSASPKPEVGVVTGIRKLTELRDMGALTQEEFEAKKAEILKRL